jgi:tetratricopeptide (TPR) repeat protein
MRRTTIGVLMSVAMLAGLYPLNEAEAQVGSCNVAADQDGRRDIARQHFMRGQELFEANEYASALALFECSFQNVPHPSTLYNIARAAELSGDFNRALDAWRGYLQMAPEAEDRAEIEARIRGIEQAVASQATPADPSAGYQPQQGYTPPQPQVNAAAAPTDWSTPEDAPSDVYTPNVAAGQEYQMVETRASSPWRQYSWYMFGGGTVIALLGVFLATPLLNLATDDEYTVENDGACYDAEADANGEYYISSGCVISGAVLAGVGAAVMIASILVYALSERGGQYVVTRRAASFTPRLAMNDQGGISGVGGTLSLSF